MPRPRKALTECRRHTIKFRVTDAEFDALHQQGADVGLSAHECARLKATRSGQVLVASDQTEPPGLFELRTELRRVGVNMNQISKRLNMTGEHEPAELREASSHLNEIFNRLLASGSAFF